MATIIRIHLAVFLLLTIFMTLASAQNCGQLQASPVISNSLDDIPPAEAVYVRDYSGGYSNPKANHQIAFVQIGPNEQQVWFSLNINFPHLGFPVFYNHRYRANESSPWYWEFDHSKAVTTFNTFVDSVLYSPTPKYMDPNGVLHKYIMYTINQPHSCDGKVFGYVTVTYSNNGTCWTPEYPLHHAGGPSSECAPEFGSDLVASEAVSAIDAGDRIYLMGVEGDALTFLAPGVADWPFLMWGYTSTLDTTTLILDSSTANPGCNVNGVASLSKFWVSACGFFNPKGIQNPGPWEPDRFRSYAYGFNMSTAWDAANGDLYYSRGYPYPYDRHALILPTPSDLAVPAGSFFDQRTAYTVFNSLMGDDQEIRGCGDGPVSAYPNRYQVYKMHIGTLANFAAVNTGTWSLVIDGGKDVGYDSDVGGVTALVPGQTAGTHSAGASSFLRDASGNLVRNGGPATIFTATTLRESLASGPCVTTGMERNFVSTIP